MRVFCAGMIVCLLACLALGCATTSPHGGKAQVMALLGQWKAAFERGDVDALMAMYADKPMLSGKSREALAKDFKETVEEKPPGTLVVNVENATVTVRDDKATALPIAVCGRTGSDTVRLALARHEGRWLIVDMDSK